MENVSTNNYTGNIQTHVQLDKIHESSSIFDEKMGRMHETAIDLSENKEELVFLKNKQNYTTNVMEMITTFLIFVPLAIACIVIGSIMKKQTGCDHIDEIGLNVSDYLLIGGCMSLIVNLLYVLESCLLTNGLIVSFSPFTKCLYLAYVFFYLIWFILGGIILFRGNLECINEKSSYVIFAVVVWCIHALNFCAGCCIATKTYNA